MIRFLSKDGTMHGIGIENAETGEDLTKLLALEYGAEIKLDKFVTARCGLLMIQANLVAAKTEFVTKHPISGDYLPLASMTFRDGTTVEFAEDGTPSVKAPA